MNLSSESSLKLMLFENWHIWNRQLQPRYG